MIIKNLLTSANLDDFLILKNFPDQVQLELNNIDNYNIYNESANKTNDNWIATLPISRVFLNCCCDLTSYYSVRNFDIYTLKYTIKKRKVKNNLKNKLEVFDLAKSVFIINFNKLDNYIRLCDIGYDFNEISRNSINCDWRYYDGSNKQIKYDIVHINKKYNKPYLIEKIHVDELMSKLIVDYKQY